MGTQVMEVSLKEHRGRVLCIKLKEDNSLAVSASSDGSCIVWDLTTKTRALCLFESTMFKNLLYHPDESQLLTTGSDRKITYWDTYDGQAIRVLEGSEEGELTTLDISGSGGHSGPITCCAIAPNQSFCVSVGQDSAIFIWAV